MMVQQNFGGPPNAGLPNPGAQPPAPSNAGLPYPLQPNAGPQYSAQQYLTPPSAASYYAMPRLPTLVPWILLIVAGTLGILLAIGIIMIPGLLFLLGGGGNVDAFDDFASGFYITALIVGIVSLAMLIAGIVRTVIVGKKRRRLKFAAMGWPVPR